ncbi:MAG TPA: hypothetical protein VIU39_03160 [Anaerolineales bacterium]|jgi:hypothetical protein
MIAITRRERIYFAAVGILALWVGLWGYFIPGLVNWAIPWLVPPLHARFLGSMYLSGATFMAGCLLARRYAEVRVVVPMIAIWTGMLLIVSLFYLDQFDYTIPPTYIWFAAYIVYPLIALWLAWKHRLDREQLPGPALPGWARAYLAVQGAGAVLLALALLFLPQAMIPAWPWKITRLLAQIYSAPFLSYGIGSLMLARQKRWSEVAIAVRAMLVFAGGVLLASLIHRSLFSAARPAAWIWLGGFIITTVMLAVLSMRSAQLSGAARPEPRGAAG